MPAEHEFMKSAKEKEMSDEEYKTLREEYDKKVSEAADRVKKVLVTFLVVFLISFAALHIFGIFTSEANYGAGSGNYTWLAIQFLLAVFFYGLKPEEDKSNQYEIDKRILLNYVKRKITAFKIRLGLVIGFGFGFAVLNIICWWFALQYASMEARQGGYVLDQVLIWIGFI